MMLFAVANCLWSIVNVFGKLILICHRIGLAFAESLMFQQRMEMRTTWMLLKTMMMIPTRMS